MSKILNGSFGVILAATFGSAAAATTDGVGDYAEPNHANLIQLASSPVITVPQGGPIAARPRREGLYDTEAFVGAVNGSIAGEYSNLSGSGTNVNTWGLIGTVQFPVDTNFGFQADTGYHSLSGGGATVDLWSLGGAAGWSGANIRLAANIRYYDFSNKFGSAHFTSYGVGGEWYFGQSQAWTLGINGGGISGTEHGSYVGGALKYYPCPRFVASGVIDYTSFGSNDHQTAYGFKGEYIVMPDTPLTVYAGYTYLSYSGGDHANLFTAGLKFYFNSGGSTPDLSRLQRMGEYGWIANGPGAFNAVY